MLSRHSVGTFHENELMSNSSGNAWPQSSQLTEPLWTDPGLSRADLHFKKKKKNESAGWESIAKLSPQILGSEEKAITTLKVYSLEAG